MKRADKKLFEEMMSVFDAGYDLTYHYHSSQHWYGEGFVYPSEAHLVQVVGRTQGITSVRISQAIPKSRSAYSQIIKKLKKKGYIEQVTNKENRREQLLYLTEEGKKLFEAHKQLEEFYLNRTYDMISDLPESDIVSYIKVQRRLNEAFEKDVADGEKAIREHMKKTT